MIIVRKQIQGRRAEWVAVCIISLPATGLQSLQESLLPENNLDPPCRTLPETITDQGLINLVFSISLFDCSNCRTLNAIQLTMKKLRSHGGAIGDLSSLYLVKTRLSLFDNTKGLLLNREVLTKLICSTKLQLFWLQIEHQSLRAL